MLKYIIVTYLATLIMFSQTVTLADTKPAPNELTNEQKKALVYQLVDKYSKQYNVSKIQMLGTIKCESADYDFSGQSELKYRKGNRWGFPEGTREKSYGIVQIHLPDHPDITYEQAIDPEFSIEFMAKEFAKGNKGAWTCFRTKFG